MVKTLHLFECAWLFCLVGAWRANNWIQHTNGNLLSTWWRFLKNCDFVISSRCTSESKYFKVIAATSSKKGCCPKNKWNRFIKFWELLVINFSKIMKGSTTKNHFLWRMWETKTWSKSGAKQGILIRRKQLKSAFLLFYTNLMSRSSVFTVDVRCFALLEMNII